MTALTKYNAAYQALQRATKIDEVKSIRDKAEALRVYAVQAKDTHMELWAAEIRIRAERKAGEFLRGMKKAKGGGDQKSNHRSSVATGGQTLADIGITKDQSSKWQKMATIPGKKFEEIFTHKTQVGEIWTSSAITKLANGTNPRVSKFTGDQESYTPPEYIEAARLVMGSIDLDPASAEQPQKWIKAKTYHTKDDEQTEKPWHGNIWMNPPYAYPLIEHFIDRLIHEFKTGYLDQAIILTNNSTDTGWFHKLAFASSSLCFTRNRIYFLKPGLNKVGERPTNGQTFFYIGKHERLFWEHFSQFGIILKNYG